MILAKIRVNEKEQPEDTSDRKNDARGTWKEWVKIVKERPSLLPIFEK